MTNSALSATLAVVMCLSANAAKALDVRFYPSERAFGYQLDSQRGNRSLVVHNIAVVNDGFEPMTVREVSLELVSAGRAVESRSLGDTELAAAAAGAGLQQGGLLDIFKF